MAKFKKILTVEDLLTFCESKSFTRFSSEETGYQLAVKVPTTFEEVENVDDNHQGMLKLKFRVFHTNLNRNGSFVSKEAATKAMNTIADRPILAAIHQLEDGTYDFKGHEMEIVVDDDGNEELRYIESQVGSFSSEPAFWEHDDELDKDYVCAYGYIPLEYTKAAEIIERKNGTKNSCELCINELAYNAKEKYLDLIDFYVSGSTLLGCKDDGTEIGEGMLGSRADIADFSKENNSVRFEQNDKLIETLEKLNATLNSLNINNTTKEGGDNQVTKFEELLKQYEVTLEEITFEYENLSDEELETAFAEAFAERKKKIEDDSTPVIPDTSDVEDPKPELTDVSEPVNEELTTDETTTIDDISNTTDVDVYAVKSVKVGEIVKEFSLSLNEKLNAIYTLVNETYSEIDGDYYDVDFFEDDNYVEMHGWFTGKHFRQGCKKKKDSYSLVGDRCEIFVKFLTEDEISKLETMKSNYSVIEDKLAKYEAEPEKIKILESEEYVSVADKVEFVELKKQKNHFDLSIDELKVKADDIILLYAKKGQLNFSLEEEKPSVGRYSIPTKKPTTRSRYGGLGKKKED